MMTDRRISRLFTEGDGSSEVLVSWWEGLDQNRGERATLRRAAAPMEVVFGLSFHRLLDGLRRRGYPLRADGAAALASVAGLAAHVKLHAGGASIAKQMATAKPSGIGAYRPRPPSVNCDHSI